MCGRLHWHIAAYRSGYIWCRFKTPTSAVSFSGKLGGLKVHLAQNGTAEEYGICKVGTTAALLTTYLAVDVFKPDIVISVGTAGGFKSKGAEIASIFLSTTTLHHDRRIPLPGFKEFGLDKKATHSMSSIAASLGVHQAISSLMVHTSFSPEACV
jgi:5'-methylthioadenosine nucleosidase